ncbi:hypothetical protein F2P81_024596 [Scophthalmus maximus]|uniref:Uncharacterized protein n=1 Tax=Scophthalmus maximus TaxID=52904 RepID=A0A6A4RN58_SCOMX|nr:hypothetical protein F2P81_024596 [Scophthalmus maximus]
MDPRNLAASAVVVALRPRFSSDTDRLRVLNSSTFYKVMVFHRGDSSRALKPSRAKALSHLSMCSSGADNRQDSDGFRLPSKRLDDDKG